LGYKFEENMQNKLVGLQDAANLVPSGCTLALGGLTLYRRPVAFVKALIRRFIESGEPRDLTLLAFTAGLECDLLVGAGMVSRVRTCYFGLEIFGLAPMFTYYANRGEIEVVEETEASLALGLRAQMAGVGFMPGRAWLGTDLPSLRPDVQTIIDPYTHETLMAFPAIHPDVAVIHAVRVDSAGNVDIGDHKAVDEELALTTARLIVTTEEIIPQLNKASLVAPLVHAVALTPGGAAPTSCHPCYPLDGSALLSYSEQVSDPDSFHQYIQNWLAD
jgi:glutaconate CoA-transferase subunit A